MPSPRFQLGTATDAADVISQLCDFCVTQGYVKDEYVGASGKAAVHYADGLVKIYPSFRWDTTAKANVGIFNALGWTNGQNPGNHPDDSGQGVISGTDATIATGRCAPLINGAMSYWFFATPNHSVYAVAKVASDTFVHFGFGAPQALDLNNAPYEFAYGHAFKSGAAAGTAVHVGSSFLLDALVDDTGVAFAASAHIEGMPNKTSSKWGVVGNIATPGTDRGGATRNKLLGGMRGGFVARAFGRPGNSNLFGIVPFTPIVIGAKQSGGTNIHLLGIMQNLGFVNMEFYAGGQSIIVGSTGNPWYLFPTHKKTGASTIGTGYSGIAYYADPGS